VKPNAELAYRVLDHIDADPESWNQMHWWCGTSGCFAGWACKLAGDDPRKRIIDGLHIADRATRHLGFPDEPSMNHAAAVKIRPGAPWGLFDADNSRADLGRIVEALFGTRPEQAS